MKTRKSLLMLAVSTAVSGGAFAAVSADEARQIGTTLTAHGAEKEGKKEGTTTHDSGQPLKTTAGYEPEDNVQRPDPARAPPILS